MKITMYNGLPFQPLFSESNGDKQLSMVIVIFSLIINVY